MKIEVLVTTMHATGFEKFYEMNIQTDVVIANQADRCEYQETEINGCRVRMITTNTRGVSINRNIAMSYATADYIMFADDDMVFVDGYKDLIEKEFLENCEAICFYSQSLNDSRLGRTRPIKRTRATARNIMSGGVWAVVVRRKFLLKHHMLFAIGYGPGTDRSMGEDSIFLKTLAQTTKKFYKSPTLVAYIKQEDSSWFDGYTDRYLENLGYLHGKIYGKLAYLSLVRRAYKLSKRNDVTESFLILLRQMYRGLHQYYK